MQQEEQQRNFNPHRMYKTGVGTGGGRERGSQDKTGSARHSWHNYHRMRQESKTSNSVHSHSHSLPSQHAHIGPRRKPFQCQSLTHCGKSSNQPCYPPYLTLGTEQHPK